MVIMSQPPLLFLLRQFTEYEPKNKQTPQTPTGRVEVKSHEYPPRTSIVCALLVLKRPETQAICLDSIHVGF